MSALDNAYTNACKKVLLQMFATRMTLDFKRICKHAGHGLLCPEKRSNPSLINV